MKRLHLYSCNFRSDIFVEAVLFGTCQIIYISVSFESQCVVYALRPNGRKLIFISAPNMTHISYFQEGYKNFRIPLAKFYKDIPDYKATQNFCDAYCINDYIIKTNHLYQQNLNLFQIRKIPHKGFSAVRFTICLYIIRFLVITCFTNIVFRWLRIMQSLFARFI